jgi:transposase-like protein
MLGALLMIKSDITCPKCGAGYRRIEVASGKRTKGEYHCLLCDHVLEVFDGSTEVAIRLTVQPTRHLNNGDDPFSN